MRTDKKQRASPIQKARRSFPLPPLWPHLGSSSSSGGAKKQSQSIYRVDLPKTVDYPRVLHADLFSGRGCVSATSSISLQPAGTYGGCVFRCVCVCVFVGDSVWMLLLASDMICGCPNIQPETQSKKSRSPTQSDHQRETRDEDRRLSIAAGILG